MMVLRLKSPNGATVTSASLGAPEFNCYRYQGLTPLAINDRRVAAQAAATKCLSFGAGGSYNQLTANHSATAARGSHYDTHPPSPAALRLQPKTPRPD